ncbi:hypothetical protein F5882DRAFT_177120 [Hyaloscypha sp. PMI_1271]|nr:hypothetical protein F5882DRAFT_177120 [Hyaloscypha sp. PMI_1271]
MCLCRECINRSVPHLSSSIIMPSKSSKRSSVRPKESKETSLHKSSGHRKEHSPQGNSTKLPTTSPQNNSIDQKASWSYDHTAATHNSAHSQYQAGSLTGLPLARTWPDSATVPSQRRLDHDLLGLKQNTTTVDSLVYPASAYPNQGLECPYHRTVHREDFAEEVSGYGLAGIDRFLAEAQSSAGAVYFGDGVIYQASPCCCFGEL